MFLITSNQRRALNMRRWDLRVDGEMLIAEQGDHKVDVILCPSELAASLALRIIAENLQDNRAVNAATQIAFDTDENGDVALNYN